MPSFEERFYLENPTLGQRLKRNLKLLVWLAAGLWSWFFPGWRLRSRYREAERKTQPLTLERELKDP